MGCDIHVMTERYRSINGESKWVNVDHWKYDTYTDKFEVVEVYGDRHYTLFSILADVRNYAEIEPMSQPKGFPEDASPHTKKDYESWDGDAHSTSHFTLAELIAAREKYRVAKYSGYVTLNEVPRVEAGDMPAMYCQGVSHPENYKWMEWTSETDPMGGLVEALIDRFCEEFWTTREYESFNSELEKHADKMRIVFWFDN